MATRRIYGPSMGTQDFDSRNVYRAYEDIIRMEYPGQENMVGAQFWGTNSLATTGLHNEVLFYTQLLGQAVHLDNLREQPPMARYEKATQIIADYQLLGIGYEYYEDEVEDELYGLTVDRISELPTLLAEAEEEEHFAPYNNGETLSGGWTDTPLFVDGTTDTLQIMGYADHFSGTAASNIIEHAGGPSYTLISLVEQYGQNFVNEEGRIAPLRVVKVMCSAQNAKLLRMLYGAAMNIEQGNPHIPNPADSSPDVVSVNRLANANDMIFFFEGWERDLKERSKWRNKSQTKSEQMPNRIITTTKSRFAYYWFSNRRVLLVRGAA